MTGEMDLHSKVTQIGGLQEKIFGAIRAGATKVLYPSQNQKDLDNIQKKHPEIHKELTNMELIPITSLKEALDLVLEE